jgi:long-chain-fatty-acid--[acyl-carrier-protein] ligase
MHLAVEKKWGETANAAPTLAVSVKEGESDKPKIILYTTFDISKDEVNTVLKANGFRKIIKIAEVRRIDQIPLTGTGKTHYRLLDDLSFQSD